VHEEHKISSYVDVIFIGQQVFLGNYLMVLVKCDIWGQYLSFSEDVITDSHPSNIPTLSRRSNKT
jgi:hypothetical protein